MIEEQARVVEVSGDDAWVEVERKSVCGSCEAKKGCGTGALTTVLGRRNDPLRVKNSLAALPGDWVVLGLNESSLLKGAAAMYLLPLLGLFFTSGIAQLVFGFPEQHSIVLGVVGFIAVLFWVRKHFRNLSKDDRYQPIMLKKTAPGVSVTVPRFGLDKAG